MSENAVQDPGMVYHGLGLTLDVVEGKIGQQGPLAAEYGDYRVEVRLVHQGESKHRECVIQWRGNRVGFIKSESGNHQDMLRKAVRFIRENDHAKDAVAERRDTMLSCYHTSQVDVWSDGYYIDEFGRHARTTVTAVAFALGWVTSVALSPAVLLLLALNCLLAGLLPPHNMTPRHGFHHHLPYFLWNLAAFPASVPYYVMRKLAPALHKCNETGDFAKDMHFRWSNWGTLRRRCKRW